MFYFFILCIFFILSIFYTDKHYQRTCQSGAKIGFLKSHGGRKVLVLSRYTDESIHIGDHIVITVVEVRGDRVRLGIEAPRDVTVHRQEIFDAIRKEAESGKMMEHNPCVH